jgi:hypothetical protein
MAKMDRWIFLAIVVIATLFYSILPVIYPPEYSIIDDSIEYAMQAEHPNPVLWFHPHHLFNNFIHRGIWMMLGGPNSGLRVVYIMRWTSHLSMGLVIAFIFILGRRMGAGIMHTILLCLLMMVACSLWVFGSVAEVVAQSTAMVLGTIWGLFYRRDGREPTLFIIFILGVLFGLAITINQIVIIYLPVFWLGMSGWRKGYRLKPILVFSLASLLWSALAYLLVMIIVLGQTGLDKAFMFATSYAHRNIWGKGDFYNLKDSLNTLMLAQSFTFYLDQKKNILFYLASVIPMLLAIGGIWGYIRYGDGRNWRLNWGYLVLFLLISFVFITWWAATAWDYWVLPWILIIMGWARWRLKPAMFVKGFLICSIAITAIYNIVNLYNPRNSDVKNPYYRAGKLISHLSPNNRELLLSVDGHLAAYTQYWGGVSNICLRTLREGTDSFEPCKKELEQLVLRKLYYGDEMEGIILDEIVHNTLQKSFNSNPDLDKWFNERCIVLFDSYKSYPPVHLFLLKCRHDW